MAYDFPLESSFNQCRYEDRNTRCAATILHLLRSNHTHTRWIRLVSYRKTTFELLLLLLQLTRISPHSATAYWTTISLATACLVSAGMEANLPPTRSAKRSWAPVTLAGISMSLASSSSSDSKVKVLTSQLSHA